MFHWKRAVILLCAEILAAIAVAVLSALVVKSLGWVSGWMALVLVGGSAYTALGLIHWWGYDWVSIRWEDRKKEGK